MGRERIFTVLTLVVLGVLIYTYHPKTTTPQHRNTPVAILMEEERATPAYISQAMAETRRQGEIEAKEWQKMRIKEDAQITLESQGSACSDPKQLCEPHHFDK